MVRNRNGRPAAPRRAGFSLLELSIVMVLLGSVVGTVTMVSRSSSRAFDACRSAAKVDAEVSRAFESIVAKLQVANEGTISPVSESPFSSSSIDFVRSTEYVAGAVVLGPVERLERRYESGDVDDGVDNDGNGIVDDGVVVWVENPGLASEREIVLCRNVAELLEGEVWNGEDDNGNGLVDEPGFCIDFEDGRATVRLTVQETDPAGVVITRTVEQTVGFRG